MLHWGRKCPPVCYFWNRKVCLFRFKTKLVGLFQQFITLHQKSYLVLVSIDNKHALYSNRCVISFFNQQLCNITTKKSELAWWCCANYCSTTLVVSMFPVFYMPVTNKLYRAIMSSVLLTWRIWLVVILLGGSLWCGRGYCTSMITSCLSVSACNSIQLYCLVRSDLST